MIRRSIKSSIAATIVLGSMMAPAAMASTTTPSGSKISKHEIIFNGKTVSNPYGIAAKDPNTGKATTYMPLWYVMEALKAVGTTYHWNGHFLNVQPSGTMTVDLSNLRPGNEDTQLAINDTVVQTGPRMVMKDPYSHVNSTYVPIFYVMDLLNRLGITSHWDGSNWTMTMTETTSVAVSAAQSTIGGGQPDQLSVTIKDNNGNTMSVPSSSVKWTISDSTDGFVNPSSNQFLATKAGTYQITASYGGVTSQPISINVYGGAAKVGLAASGTLVADGKSALTVNVSALDANGATAAGENGSVTITDTQGWLVTGSNNGVYTTGKSVTVPLKAGAGTVQVVATSTPGLSDTLTASALSDPQNNATITYGTVSLTSVSQQATSLKITPVNGQQYLVANQAGQTAQFDVTVLDQGGQPMSTGSYPYNISVTGPATYNGATTGLYVGGSNPIPITVTSQQGATGTVTVNVSANGLQSAGTTVQSVIAQSATKITATSATGSNSFAEGATLMYTLAGQDNNGYPTTFPSNPLTVYVTNSQGMPATNILVNGQAMSSAGVALGSGQNLDLSDSTNGANAGTYTLVVKDSSGTTWLNQTVTETAGTATQLTITPSTNEVAEANPSTALTLQFTDAYKNPAVPSTLSNMTVKAANGVGSATINGQVATAGVSVTPNANGQAVVQFVPQSPAGTTWNITATAGSMTSNQATVSVMNTLVSAATVSMTDINGSTTTTTAGHQLKFVFGALDSFGNVYNGNDQFAVSFPTGALNGVGSGLDSAGVTTVVGTLSQLNTDFASATAGAAQTLQVHIVDQNVSSARSGTAQLQVLAGPFAGFAVFTTSNQLISAANPLPVASNTPVQVFVRPVDQYGNPVNTATEADTVDLLDGGANGYFRTTPSGANDAQLSFPIGTSSEPVYYVNGSSTNAVLTAAKSQLDTTTSSVYMNAFTQYATGKNGAGTLTVMLKDSNKYPVTNQANQLTASVTNGTGVTVSGFAETAPGIYTAQVTSTANNSNVTISVKDGSTTVGTTAAFNS